MAVTAATNGATTASKSIVKNIVVIGASYAGARAAELLAQSLPRNHRVILIDKNSHFNHIYRFVRFGVVPGHEAKVFVPYTNVFNRTLNKSPLISEHHCPAGEQVEAAKSIFIHAQVVNISKKYVEVDRSLCEVDGITENCVIPHEAEPIGCSAYTRAKANGTLDQGFNCTCLNGPDGPREDVQSKTTKIRFDYLIYAAGSIMPRPLWSNSRTKGEGMKFLQDQQSVIKRASSVLIVGGGALGIQYASDIKDLYPDKKVTLVHSRDRLLPVFDEKLHNIVLARLKDMGIDVILGDRVILPEGHLFEGKELDHRVLKTQKGREIESDLQLFCTGQKPNTSLIRKCMPTAIGKDGYIQVHRTMQIKALGHNVPHMFAVGDCIDAFGAIKAGHTGWNQAGVAANNILKIVHAREHGEPLPDLEEYQPGLPQISVSLGLSQSAKQLVNSEGNLEIAEHHGEAVDSYWEAMWSALGVMSDDPFV